MAPDGSAVQKGRPVVGFDTSALVRELEQKKAERDSAKTDFDKTEGDLRMQAEKDVLALAEAEARLRKVNFKLDVPGELIASNERKLGEFDREIARKETEYLRRKIETAALAGREGLAILRTQRERAEGRVREIESQLELMMLKAPRDGTVLYATDWRGEKKKVGDSTWRGQPILEIPDLSAMFARGEVDESDAGRVSVGQRVRLRLDAHPDLEFQGVVGRLANAVVRQSPRNPLRILEIEVRLDRTDSARMRPGMRFRGVIEKGRVHDAVLVPIDAVVATDRGPVVYRRRLGALTEVLVQPGARNAKLVEVRKGISPGDVVRINSPASGGG
jgi:hypothetical protein